MLGLESIDEVLGRGSGMCSAVKRKLVETENKANSEIAEANKRCEDIRLDAKRKL